MKFTYKDELFQLVHKKDDVKSNRHSIHTLLIKDSNGVTVAYVLLMADTDNKIVYDHRAYIEPIYRNTPFINVLIEEYSNLHNKYFQGYQYHYTYTNKKLHKLVERKVKNGKLPSELISNRISYLKPTLERTRMKLNFAFAYLDLNKDMEYIKRRISGL